MTTRSRLAIAFDTETTGLTLHPDADLALQPKIIELGTVLFSLTDGSIVEEYDQLINPGEPLSPEIIRITGLTDDSLRDAPRFVEVLPELRALFGRASAVVAHNLPFDRAVLRGELRRVAAEDFPWPAVELCTVGAYRAEWGRNPKLTELYEATMGRPLAQTHRALDDVRAMVEIVMKDELWRLL